MSRIYISGPISNMLDLNKPAFAAAADLIRSFGHDPVNPHDIVPKKRTPAWSDHMRADIKALMDCDVLIHLPTWSNSKGARVEWQIAFALGMPCISLNAFPRWAVTYPLRVAA